MSQSVVQHNQSSRAVQHCACHRDARITRSYGKGCSSCEGGYAFFRRHARHSQKQRVGGLPAQSDKVAAAKQVRKRSFSTILKAASQEYHAEQQTGVKVNANAIARRFNESSADDVDTLEGWRIRAHVAQGLAGLSPLGKGPKPVVPDEVVALMSTHTSMSQLNGNELKPRAIRQSLIALVQGSSLEQHLKSKQQRAKFLKRLRQLQVAGVSLTAVPKLLCDNRRWMWCTYINVDNYFVVREMVIFE